MKGLEDDGATSLRVLDTRKSGDDCTVAMTPPHRLRDLELVEHSDGFEHG